MKTVVNWYQWLNMSFKEFLNETKNKSYAEIVDIYECEKTGFAKAVIKLADRHITEKKY